MESKQAEMRFVPGAEARIYTGEGSCRTVIGQVAQERVFLLPPRENIRFVYNEPVSLVQRFFDGSGLMVLLRFEERGKLTTTVFDQYRIVPGTRMQLQPGLHRLSMYAWCGLTVFEVHRPETVLWEGTAHLCELSGGSAAAIVGEALPLGAFAQCTFELGGETVTARLVVSRVEKPEDSPLCRVRFSFIDTALQPRIEEYLVEERARRMRHASD